LNLLKKYFRFALKLLVGISAGLTILVIALIFLLRLPAVQIFVARQAEDAVQSNFGININLERVMVHFPLSLEIREIFIEDAEGDTLLYSGKIRADVNMIALLRKRVEVRRFSIEDLKANITRSYPDEEFNYEFILRAFAADLDEGVIDPEHSGNETKPWAIEPDVFLVNIAEVNYSDYKSGIDMYVGLHHFNTNIEVLKPEENRYHIGNTTLSGAVFSMDTNESSNNRLPVPENIAEGIAEIRTDGYPVPVLQKTAAQNGMSDFQWGKMFNWSLSTGIIDVSNTAITVSGGDRQPAGEFFDPGNFSFSDIGFRINGLMATPDTVGLQLDNLSFKTNGVFQLEDLSAGLFLGRSIHVEGLMVKTPDSKIEASVRTGLDFGDFNLSGMDDVPFSLMVKSTLTGSDIAFFIPEVPRYLKNTDSGEITFDVFAKGTPGSFIVEDLNADIPGMLNLQSEPFSVSGLYGEKITEVEMPRIEFWADTRTVLAFFPHTGLTDQPGFPDYVDAQLAFSGNTENFRSSAYIVSSLGVLDADITVDSLLGKYPGYNVMLNMTGFNPGQITGIDDIPEGISASVRIEGTGFNPDITNAEFSVRAEEFVYRDYNYRGLEIDGTLEEGVLRTGLVYKDGNLDFSSFSELFFKKDYHSLKGHMDLFHADLNALNLSDDPLVLSTGIITDVRLAGDDFIEGWLSLSGTGIDHGDIRYNLDTLMVTSSSEGELYRLDIGSDLLEASFSGNFSPLHIPHVVLTHMNEYLDFHISEIGILPDERRFFDFNINIFPSIWYTGLILPSLVSFEPFSIDGGYDSETGILTLKSAMPMLDYNGMEFRDFSFFIDTEPDKLSFSLLLPLFETEDFAIRNFSSTGHIENDIFAFNIQFDDREHRPWLSFPGTISSFDNGFELTTGKELTIAGEKWLTEENHFIRLGKEMLAIHNFRLESSFGDIIIESEQPSMHISPIKAQFLDLQLDPFFTRNDEIFARGRLNGSLLVDSVFGNLSFNTHLELEQLSYMQDTLGDVTLHLHNREKEILAGTFSLSSRHGAHVNLAGFFNTSESQDIGLDISMSDLNIAYFSSLMPAGFKDPEGTLSADVKVGGSLNNPEITGKVGFYKVAVTPEALNTRFTLSDETLTFRRDNLNFANFRIADRAGNMAFINGNLGIGGLDDIKFDLRFTSGNFIAMDLPQGSNGLFHGRAIIDSDINLKGDLNRLGADGRLRLNEGSHLTILLPQTIPQEVGDEGVVEFIGADTPGFEEALADKEIPERIARSYPNLDLAINLEVDPQTNLRVIVDEIAGDYLDIRGGGTISYGTDPGGNIFLSGRYEIAEGSYQITFYDVIRRHFNIQSGSSLVWSGDPMDADINITALYNVRTSARELMTLPADGSGQKDPDLSRLYPFQVILNMKGDLMNPEIDFGISLPREHQRAIGGRLQNRLDELNRNESELNKQVFALLVMGSFIQENPLATIENGTGLSTAARASVSRMLSQQLNRMSERYIRGVNINFEVESYEDYTGVGIGGRTDLSVEVSRNFFDERLRITAGGNIELEDERRRETGAEDIAGDFQVEYLLNPDGSLIIKGFRKEQFYDVFEGEIIETGVSLMFTRSYNRLRELFGRREEEPVPVMDEKPDEY